MTVFSFGAAYLWLDIWVRAANNGFDPKLSRKIIHSGSAPLFMLLWPLYSAEPSAKYVAAMVPFLQMVRLVYAGRLRTQPTQPPHHKDTTAAATSGAAPVMDGGIVKAISRSGSPHEAIQGPLIYTVVLLVCTAVFFRHSAVGVVAVLQMAMGDGLADIVGRRFGKRKWPFSDHKSYMGSLAFVLGSFAACTGILALFAETGVLQLDVAAALPRILLISIICAVVELSDIADDNWTVPLAGVVAAKLLL
jgi:dolichol kinase